MEQSKQMVVVAILALAMGFIGGLVSNHFSRVPISPVVRATRFELTDSRGRTRAFWGEEFVTADTKALALVFLDDNKKPRLRMSLSGDSERQELGFLEADGRPRLSLYNSPSPWGGPKLSMGNESGVGRIVLGFAPLPEDVPAKPPSADEWGLVFAKPPFGDWAVLGVGKNWQTSKTTGLFGLSLEDGTRWGPPYPTARQGR